MAIIKPKTLFQTFECQLNKIKIIIFLWYE